MPPAIAVKSPTPGSFQTATSVYVSATVWDADGVDAGSLSLTLDGTGWPHQWQSSFWITATIGNLTFGPHLLQVSARDVNGVGPTLATWNFSYDPVPPSATVEPLPPTWTERNITVRVAASDTGSWVTKVQLSYSRNGGPRIRLTGLLQPPWSWTLSVDELGGEGTFVFYATAWDAAGNQGLESEVWTVVNLPEPVTFPWESLFLVLFAVLAAILFGLRRRASRRSPRPAEIKASVLKAPPTSEAILGRTPPPHALSSRERVASDTFWGQQHQARIAEQVGSILSAVAVVLHLLTIPLGLLELKMLVEEAVGGAITWDALFQAVARSGYLWLLVLGIGLQVVLACLSVFGSISFRVSGAEWAPFFVAEGIAGMAASLLVFGGLLGAAGGALMVVGAALVWALGGAKATGTHPSRNP